MRIRAITSIGMVAVALLAVSACRVEQGAALFVGDERITQQRVDEVVDGIPDDARDDLEKRAGFSTGGLRSYVVQSLATVELGKLVAADTEASPDASAAGKARLGWKESNMDSDSEFVDLVAASAAYRPVLLDGADPDAPTKAEIDANTDTLAQLSKKEPNKHERKQLRGTVDAFLNSEPGQAALGQQRQVDKFIAEYDLTANPRYGPSYILVAPSAHQQPPVLASIPS